ncbi:hypothetical protein mRhiFer1_007830 [Rhinolophus ferrumequinum]|uniref:W2 domain-containing protein n=2 Tax=Rhinolophus ferrumequinum TaxID=59479 RepID=A0A7J8AVV7_RHIFE|nr:hypothetical protein mRhiFer1_007830 [Rhinolophus ferrumequinum]
MYDTDLLEEEVISWSEKASKKYVSKELDKEIRVKAEPFIKWLKEAKEESSGSGDDEDKNIEMMYSKTASVPKVEAAKSDNKDDDIDLMPFKGVDVAQLNSVMLRIFLHHQPEVQHICAKAKMAYHHATLSTKNVLL